MTKQKTQEIQFSEKDWAELIRLRRIFDLGGLKIVHNKKRLIKERKK